MKSINNRGVSLIELLVVLLIVSILSTVAAGVYVQEIQKAKIARARAEISTLEVAINRYFLDTGQYPPSSSSTTTLPINPDNPANGTGYLQIALRFGFPDPGGTSAWNGPYIEWDDNRLGTLSGNPITDSTEPSEILFLDPWFNEYTYISSNDYATLDGTELTTNPYSGVLGLETNFDYYNPNTFQIFSPGPNGTTSTGAGERGTEPDDLNNWEGTGL